MEDDIEEGAVHVKVTEYSKKPNFLNLFIKNLTRDLVVPTMSARMS